MLSSRPSGGIADSSGAATPAVQWLEVGKEEEQPSKNPGFCTSGYYLAWKRRHDGSVLPCITLLCA